MTFTGAGRVSCGPRERPPVGVDVWASVGARRVIFSCHEIVFFRWLPLLCHSLSAPGIKAGMWGLALGSRFAPALGLGEGRKEQQRHLLGTVGAEKSRKHWRPLFLRAVDTW